MATKKEEKKEVTKCPKKPGEAKHRHYRIIHAFERLNGALVAVTTSGKLLQQSVKHGEKPEWVEIDGPWDCYDEEKELGNIATESTLLE